MKSTTAVSLHVFLAVALVACALGGSSNQAPASTPAATTISAATSAPHPVDIDVPAPERVEPRMHWTISLADRQTGRWGVVGELRGLHTLREQGRVPGDAITWHMPNWTPGVYLRDVMGANVEEFTAADAQSGNVLAARRVADDTWRVALPEGDNDVPAAVRISYRTPAQARFVRGRLGPNYANFLGTAMFLYLRDVLDLPSTVTFVDIPDGWVVHTPMHPTEDPFTFTVADYDELVDSPTLIGPFGMDSFEVDGKTIEIVVAAPEDSVEPARRRLIEPVRKICEVAAEMMGGLPFQRYTFLYFLRPAGFGGSGLEHTNATQIWTSVAGVLNDDQMHTTLFITAHEFFHLWNVKRLRAEPIRTYDYSRLPEIDCLWFHEGVTSYYTDVYLARAGLMSPERFRRRMSQLLSSLNRSTDYYLQGEAWGFLLDAMIRHHTDNRKSFDDVILVLWHHYGIPERGFDQTAAVARVASGVAGTDLTWFAERYILGGEQTPIAAIADALGMSFEPTGRGRNVGYWGLGTHIDEAGGDVRLDYVMPLGPAAQAGLRVGDVVEAVGGEQITRFNRMRLLRGGSPGADVTLRIRRGQESEPREVTLTLGRHVDGSGVLRLPDMDDESSPAALVFRGIVTGTHPWAAPTPGNGAVVEDGRSSDAAE